METTFSKLNQIVIRCVRCPRLVEFRENVPLSKKYEGTPCWRRPVPGFGDPKGWLLILGLAPAAQGGNRTGRIFTGDESGRFLMSCLYEADFSNSPSSESADDGLQLKGCYITAAVKCVPPANKPLASEVRNCSGYLENEFFLLKDHLKAVLALGGLAFDTYLALMKKKMPLKYPSFSHGQRVRFEKGPTLYASYHPSPQNTYTKKLTREMFLSLLKEIKRDTKLLS